VLDLKKLQRLNQLKYRDTRYEVVLVNSSGTEIYLVAYTARRGKMALVNAIRNVFEHVDRIARVADETKITTKYIQINPNWRVAYSGRTERQAITEGEHPKV